MAHPALVDAAHRPWPLPHRPWSLRMRWRDLLFLHWPVEPGALQRHLPDGLRVETFDGAAWLGVVPFVMDDTRVRWLPPVPTARRFPECNLRTYVRPRGAGGHARPGVWFFSLDAHSRLAVEGARWSFGLPYFRAAMRCRRDADAVDYASERTDRRAPPARFAARWRQAGAFAPARPGTLEHFLVERYCLYAVRGGRLIVGDVAHAPWQLAAADVALAECDMTQLVGVELPAAPRSALVAAPLDVLGWSPVAVGS